MDNRTPEQIKRDANLLLDKEFAGLRKASNGKSPSESAIIGDTTTMDIRVPLEAETKPGSDEFRSGPHSAVDPRPGHRSPQPPMRP